MAPLPALSGSVHDDPGLGPGLSPPTVPGPPRGGPQPSPQGQAFPSSSGFVAVPPRSGESGDAMTTLVAAYTVMWLLLLGFVWILARRQARVDGRLARLEEAVLQASKHRE